MSGLYVRNALGEWVKRGAWSGSVVGGGAGDTPLWAADFTQGSSTLVPEVTDTSGGTFSHVGDGVARITYNDADSVPGWKARSRFHNASGANGKYLGIAELTEATLHFECFVPRSMRDNLYEYSNAKLPGLGGLPDNQTGWYTSSGGGRTADSHSLRLHVCTGDSYSGGSAYLVNYVYANYAAGITFDSNGMYGTTKYGIWVPLTTDGSKNVSSPMSGKNVRVPVDVWFAIDIYVKMNTVSTRDGIIRTWLDGNEYTNVTDVQWVDNGYTPRINQLLNEWFVNTNAGTASGQTDVRNMKIYEGLRVPA